MMKVGIVEREDIVEKEVLVRVPMIESLGRHAEHNYGRKTKKNVSMCREIIVAKEESTISRSSRLA
jgi:hypothetical protein